MPVRVDIAPTLIAWATVRSGRDPADLEGRFPALRAWKSGEVRPTLKQLEKFASATYTPLGAFFLPEPPVDRLPVPDFRTMGDEEPAQPSPDLLDTVFLCEQRQEWYRDYARANGQPAHELVGSLSIATRSGEAAAEMRTSLGFELSGRGEYASWSDALRGLATHAEAVGILVMVSGVVGSNTQRKLNPEEFRGFALVDSLAPLIFINGADTKAAQIFTLAHELAHVWIGQSAVSDPSLGGIPRNDTERWCNEVAAELLVPLASLGEQVRADEPLDEALRRLARVYRVSTLVVLRRLFDSGRLRWKEYRAAYRDELARVQTVRPAKSGGDFYNTQPVRASKLFARAVVTDTLEGRTLHRDAFRLLGVRKQSTFEELGQRLGVI